MAVVLPGKLVYLHVPKTGGKWVKRVLFGGISGARLFRETNHGNQWAKSAHCDLEDLKDVAGFRLAFVRHPADWWRSYWRYQQTHGRFRNESLELVRLVKADTFERYVDNVLERLPGYASRMFSRFVGEPGQEIDFIGKQENLTSDLRTALGLAGFDLSAFDFSASRINEGGTTTEHFEFSPEQRRALSLAESAGIERFGYEPWH
jgi:hypothetical protein